MDLLEKMVKLDADEPTADERENGVTKLRYHWLVVVCILTPDLQIPHVSRATQFDKHARNSSRSHQGIDYLQAQHVLLNTI